MTEVNLAVHVLDRMLEPGQPNYVTSSDLTDWACCVHSSDPGIMLANAEDLGRDAGCSRSIAKIAEETRP